MPTVDSTLRERQPTGFIGSLSDTPLAEVFRRIVSEERSGDLQVTTPDAIKTVYFDRGFVVFASSNRKKDRLGESMVEAGRISPGEFAAASGLMKASRVKFGRALVSSGIVSEEELGHYVAAQVNRIVLSLFSAKRGMYSFDERPTAIPLDLRVSLSVYRILMEGVRHMTSKRLVLAGLPSLDSDVALVDRPPFALDLGVLRQVERSVLKAVSRRPEAIRVLIDKVGGDEGVVLRAIYGLIAAGVLEAKSETGKGPISVQFETGTFLLSEISQRVSAPEPAPRQAPATTEPAGARSPVPRAPVARVPPRIPPPAPPPREESATGIWASLKGIWAAILSLLGFSSEEPVDRRIAPIPVAPRPRSEAAPRLESPKAPPPVDGPAVSVPEKPPGNPAEPVGVPSWSVVDPPEVNREPNRGPERAGVPEWSVADNPVDQFRDFFEEQGVPLGPAQEHQEATSGQALVSSSFGPDVPGELPEDDAPSMFAQIPIEEIALGGESVRLELEDDVAFAGEVETEVEPQSPAAVERAESRPEPTRPVTPTPAPTPVVPTAATATGTTAEEEPPRGLAQAQARRRSQQLGGESGLLRDVKLHFQLRDWEGVVPLLERLLEISPGNAQYRGMLARALSLHPSRGKEAEEQFVEALRLSPRDAQIHYWLGLYYKSFGLGSRAENEFRTTLRIDPRHEGARRQLGASGSSDDTLGSVIKKLFG